MTGLAALRRALAGRLSERRKRAFKSQLAEIRTWLIRSLRGYDGAALTARLRRAGIGEADTLLVHANFKPDSGFRGAPLDLVNALVELVGARGNLLMVSIPFRGTAYDYLMQNKPFNVQKTISMMGLATEMFRRRDGTLRSLHPTHPVLAFGKDAPWLVADHERCQFPCGPGSPFEKFRRLNGKILFFDVSFGAITFFHHVEHLVRDRLPFPVYDERLFAVTAVDGRGERHTVQTYTFSRNIARDAAALEAGMRRRAMTHRGRIGNSRFLWVTAEDVVTCFTEMVAAGTYPYDV